MTSVGTVHTPIIELSLKPDRGRESVLVAGRMKMRGTGTIESYDLGLRTVKSFQATPFAGPAGLHGSITGPAGELDNAVAFIGTVARGTVTFSYLAVGA
ncbi:unnamed protein product [marine sediment metagenome]|uniref:Uncharacterized protein n=1 Tax=marine sediment metagenome TaxID=412755 RepID=X1VG58_9ZZZZ